MSGVNDAPVAADDTTTTAEDTAKAIAALANDTDADPGTTLRVGAYGQPAHGTVTSTTAGFTYTPAADYNGADSFTYKASDGAALSASATVDIAVTPVNDAPVARDDTTTTAQDGTVKALAGRLANDTDIDGDTLTSARSGTSARPTAPPPRRRPASPVRAGRGLRRYRLFSYTAFDGDGVSDYATVTITVTPSAVCLPHRHPRRGRGPLRGRGEHGAKGWNADDTLGRDLSHVVVACGESGKEADPLAAAGLAGVYDAPVLLVRNSATLPAYTRNTIAAIGSANASISVHIVGGTASVPSGAASALAKLTNVKHVTRIAGADRYEVTAHIAERMASVVGTPAMPGALIICAENPAAFYDALAASPAAYRAHLPMLGGARQVRALVGLRRARDAAGGQAALRGVGSHATSVRRVHQGGLHRAPRDLDELLHRRVPDRLRGPRARLGP